MDESVYSEATDLRVGSETNKIAHSLCLGPQPNLPQSGDEGLDSRKREESISLTSSAPSSSARLCGELIDHQWEEETKNLGSLRNGSSYHHYLICPPGQGLSVFDAYYRPSFRPGF